MKQVLTEGNIGKGLILFSLPMIAGNLLQQLYNVVDTLIVGQTIGAQALSAVGSSYALMVLLTSVILGLCMGSGVVFSQLYGANREEEVKVSIVNAFVLIFLVSAVVMVLSYLLLNSIVVWMQIPKEAIVYVKEYLTIIFSGILFVFLYNFFSAILRSVGNTFIPLVFLGVSAFLNIVLDLVFILVFHMGVKGAAWATVSAQVVSAIGVMVYFFLKGKELCPARKHLFYDQNLLHMVIVNSTLTAIQQSIMNFGILMATGHPWIHFAFLQLMQREASSWASSWLYPRHTSLKFVALSFGSCSLTGIFFNTSIIPHLRSFRIRRDG